MADYDLVPVTEEDDKLRAVLINLTKMYCYEWSQYLGMEVDEKGEYVFEKHLPSYWLKPERKAFLLRCTADPEKPSWAGFALIDRDLIIHKDYDYSLAEFFVMFVHRRRGAGRTMAVKLFEMFPGRWELGRNPNNKTSVAFWDRVLRDYTRNNFELVRSCPEHRFTDGTLGDVLSFDNSTGFPDTSESPV